METQQEQDRKQRHIILIISLSVLLIVAVTALILVWSQNRSFTVRVDDNFITSESASVAESGRYTAPAVLRDYEPVGFMNKLRNRRSEPDNTVHLELHKLHRDDNVRFNVVNMFPGDYEVKNFCVRVSTPGTTTVYYRADIRDGSEKLAEVLMCRITMPDEGEVLYEGLMRDMPSELAFTVTSGGGRTEYDLYYTIEAWLDTSVGNEYMNKTLIADFKWWADPSQLAPPTGDSARPYLWAGIGILACGALVVLLVRGRRKEGEE